MEWYVFMQVERHSWRHCQGIADLDSWRPTLEISRPRLHLRLLRKAQVSSELVWLDCLVVASAGASHSSSIEVATKSDE